MRAVLVVLLGAVCDAYVIHNAPAVRPVASRALAPIMAAKKAKAKKSSGAGAKGGGFGTATAPKTVAEVCKTFKHRLPKDFTELCICRDKSEAGNAGTSYADCCRQMHLGEKNAETPEECLRARFAAYAYRQPEFIIRSTDKTSSEFKKDKLKWARSLDSRGMFDTYDFVKLEVGEAEVGKPEGDSPVYFLSPNVFTLQPKGQLSKPPVATAERSKFIKRKAGWLFVEGSEPTAKEAPAAADLLLTDEEATAASAAEASAAKAAEEAAAAAEAKAAEEASAAAAAAEAEAAASAKAAEEAAAAKAAEEAAAAKAAEEAAAAKAAEEAAAVKAAADAAAAAKAAEEAAAAKAAEEAKAAQEAAAAKAAEEAAAAAAAAEAAAAAKAAEEEEAMKGEAPDGFEWGGVF